MVEWDRVYPHDRIFPVDKRISTVITITFFAVVLITGFIVYKDYGIPWDEPLQINIARLNDAYIFKHDPSLLSFRDKYYGMVFELPLLWITQSASIPRHLLLFLIFVGGMFFLYKLANHLFQNRWWALLSAVLLSASPRMLADSFYNSKDIPFLVICVVTVWTLTVISEAIRKGLGGWPILGLLFIHSFTSAATISTRVAGVMLVPVTLLVLIVDFVQIRPSWVRMLWIIAGYLLFTGVITVLTWPVLWHSPWSEFLGAYQKMSRLPYDISMLYLGHYINASQLPWHYLPVWIGITTPLIILGGFPFGIIGWMRLLRVGWKQRDPHRPSFRSYPTSQMLYWTVIILWLALPVAAIYKYHSVLYDGWRHVFFIYPPILLIGVLGLRTVYQWLVKAIPARLAVNIFSALALAAGLAEPVAFMAQNHPFENVYFNVFAGDFSTLRSRFEMDYWGLSYKQGIDYILATDARPTIKIAVANKPGEFYIDGALTRAQQSRLVLETDPRSADYFVTDFRWHPQDYPGLNEVYSIQVRGATILAVYKVH
jgi:hypothetical protein